MDNPLPHKPYPQLFIYALAHEPMNLFSYPYAEWINTTLTRQHDNEQTYKRFLAIEERRLHFDHSLPCLALTQQTITDEMSGTCATSTSSLLSILSFLDRKFDARTVILQRPELKKCRNLNGRINKKEKQPTDYILVAIISTEAAPCHRWTNAGRKSCLLKWSHLPKVTKSRVEH
jgi:hypothetical protein